MHDKLVKKGKSVNPFLTLMNFKISFRTWKKYSDENSNCKHSHPAEKKHVIVDIEVENFFEVTSEEEEEVETLVSARSNSCSNKRQSMTLTRSLTKRINKERKHLCKDCIGIEALSV